MRAVCLLFVALCVSACDVIGGRADDVGFADPVRHVVQAGETLEGLSQRYGVGLADLHATNALQADPRPGDVLLVWATRDLVIEASQPQVASIGGTRRSVSRARSPTRRKLAPIGGSVRDAGIFGADDLLTAGLDVDVSNLGRQGSVSLGGLGERHSLSSGGQAESLGTIDRVKLSSEPPARFVPDTRVRAARLSKPAAKRCLAGPSGSGMADEDMVTGGLDSAAIRRGLQPVARYTGRCLPSGSRGAFKLLVDVTVGCDGRVSRAEVIDADGVTPQVAQCIETTIASAGFPAHALPDGVGFTIPIDLTSRAP